MRLRHLIIMAACGLGLGVMPGCTNPVADHKSTAAQATTNPIPAPTPADDGSTGITGTIGDSRTTPPTGPTPSASPTSPR